MLTQVDITVSSLTINIHTFKHFTPNPTLMVRLDLGGRRKSEREQSRVGRKIDNFSAKSTLLSSTPLPSLSFQIGPKSLYLSLFQGCKFCTNFKYPQNVLNKLLSCTVDSSSVSIGFFFFGGGVWRINGKSVSIGFNISTDTRNPKKNGGYKTSYSA